MLYVNVIREGRGSKGIKLIVVNAISITNPGTESFCRFIGQKFDSFSGVTSKRILYWKLL
jgi:hypothetical protein